MIRLLLCAWRRHHEWEAIGLWVGSGVLFRCSTCGKVRSQAT